MASGLANLQGRRSAAASDKLFLAQTGALNDLGVQAEGQKNARLGQLGGATQMKNADLMQQFDINKMTPYNRILALKQLKSQAANEEYARDVNNTMSALGNAASIGTSASSNNSIFGSGKGGLQKQYNANNDNIKSMLKTVPYVGE
jgi:hypothetical protein